MFPYFELFGFKMYMTGIGVVFFLVSFISVSKYLCNKRHQDFYKLFYRLPIAVFFVYFFGSYVNFFLNIGLFPIDYEQLKILLNPYGYSFYFVGLLIGFVFSLYIFFKQIKRNENKRVWIDIMFFSIVLSLIPFGVFLAFGDSFIGKPYSGFLAIKPLTTETELNKFGSVYPVGLFLSFVSIIVTLVMFFVKRKTKSFGAGLLGFIYLLIGLNIVFLFQQYPRYGVLSFGSLLFDIKNYLSFFVIMFCLLVYYRWK